MNRPWLILALFLGLLVCSLGCGGGETTTSSSGGAGGGTTSSGGACGAGLVCDGAGMCTGCDVPADCPGNDDECVRVTHSKAGVYGTITRRGRLKVGQTIFFEPQARHGERL